MPKTAKNRDLLLAILNGNFPSQLPLYAEDSKKYLCRSAARAGIREGPLRHHMRFNRCQGVINRYNDGAEQYNKNNCGSDLNCRRNEYLKHLGPVLPPIQYR